jgi:hypothetical protein
MFSAPKGFLGSVIVFSLTLVTACKEGRIRVRPPQVIMSKKTGTMYFANDALQASRTAESVREQTPILVHRIKAY